MTGTPLGEGLSLQPRKVVMARTAVVTGSASGIGEALRRLLTARGQRVIGVDRHSADVVVDLSTVAGRAEMIERVIALSDGRLDAVFANAGVATLDPALAALLPAVNFFGAIATLEGLRPLLRGSSAPRAVATVSKAAVHPVDDAIVETMLAGDEPATLSRATAMAQDQGTHRLLYASTKHALARWLRRNAATDAWAGASIPLNGVAPGTMTTPMNAKHLADPATRDYIMRVVPMPLNGLGDGMVVARLLAWLGSEENTHVCGQVILVDGGSEVLQRGDAIF